MRGEHMHGSLKAAVFTGLLATLVGLGSCTDASDFRRVGSGVQLNSEPVAQPVEMRRLYDWRVRVQLREGARFIVQDSVSWREVWQKASQESGQASSSPWVDFKVERVAVLALGARPQLAYSASIDSAVRLGDSIIVFATERVSECPSGTAVTHPTDMVALRTVARAARFEVGSSREPCS